MNTRPKTKVGRKPHETYYYYHTYVPCGRGKLEARSPGNCFSSASEVNEKQRTHKM